MKKILKKYLSVVVVCSIALMLFGCSTVTKQEQTFDDIIAIVEDGLGDKISSGGGAWNGDIHTYLKVIDGIDFKNKNEKVLNYLAQYDEKKEIVSVTGDQFDWKVELANGCLVTGKVTLSDKTVTLGVAYKKGEYYKDKIDLEHYNAQKNTLDNLATLTKEIRYVTQDTMWTKLFDIISKAPKTREAIVRLDANELTYMDFENLDSLQLTADILAFEVEYGDQIAYLSSDSVDLEFYNGIKISCDSNYYAYGHKFVSINVNR